MSRSELAFYCVLKKAVNGRAEIFSKVALKEFIKAHNGREYYKYYSKIAQKHVDYLLCRTDTLGVLAAIELDDSSHYSKKAIERDMFKNELLEQLNIPLIRLWVSNSYSVEQLEDALNKHLPPERMAPSLKIVKNSLGLNSIDLQDVGLNLLAKDQEKTCPECSKEMVLREAYRGPYIGRKFWGCSYYPACKGLTAISK